MAGVGLSRYEVRTKQGEDEQYGEGLFHFLKNLYNDVGASFIPDGTPSFSVRS